MTKPFLILGTAQIDQTYGAVRQEERNQHEKNWLRLLESAQGLGFQAIDTAHAYPGAHQLIGRSTWKGPIHTKISNADSSLQELNDAKNLCGRDTFEAVYFHQSSIARDRPEVTRNVARALLGSGAQKVGVSVYGIDEYRAALGIDEITVLQVPINPLDQRFNDSVLKDAKESGKLVVGRGVFLQGLLLSRGNLVRPLSQELAESISAFFDYSESVGIEPMDLCFHYASSMQNLDALVLGFEDVNQASEATKTWSDVVSRNTQPSIAFELLRAEPKIVDPRTW